MDLNFQIGLLIGEKIVDKELLTLSTDMLKTRNVIQVSEKLSKQWKEKNDHWFSLTKTNKEEATKIFYENLSWYKKNIEQVYLPYVIKCYYSFSYENKEELIKGIEMALWDSDLSHYKFENIKKGKYAHKITLRYEA